MYVCILQKFASRKATEIFFELINFIEKELDRETRLLFTRDI